MPVKVKCPNCEKALSAPDAARGKAIKCPECQTRIAIPEEEASSRPASKAATTKSKVKKAAKPIDSESALATFDMRRAEDTEARVCPKCGHDMQYQDEEDTECPKCGYDAEAGGMGARARKKAMKGPDPADFYPGLFKQSWKFVGKNQLLAWRTVAYTLVCLAISGFCAFMYLWVSAWPPRAFLGLCFTVSFLVIPGWMWFLDTEVIKLTLERKDKFRKLNFDFFLASAMGLAFVFWCVAVALPLVALPAGIGWLMVQFGGMPQIVLPIFAGLGVIPAVWMLPVVMSHMSMPVQYKGWMIWKVVPLAFRNFKPLTMWFMLFIATNILNIAGVVVIAAVFGNEIQAIVQRMEFNAQINRAKAELVENPNAQKKGKKPPDPNSPEAIQRRNTEEKARTEFLSVTFIPLIAPAVILALMAVANGFTSMFNMRTNGQFTFYNKGSLEMIDRAKEYKYVARERRDKDEDDYKPKTTSQALVEAFVFLLVFDLLGVVGGMVYGAAFSSDGVVLGILRGLLIAHSLANVSIWFQCLQVAFTDSIKWGLITLLVPLDIGFYIFCFQDFEQRNVYFFKRLLGTVLGVIIMIVVVVAGVLTLFSKIDEAAQQQDPAQMMQNQNPMMNQMQNPGMQGPPGQPGMSMPQGGMPQGSMPPQGTQPAPAQGPPATPPGQ